jgi:glycosyltransferase 2 family protein
MLWFAFLFVLLLALIPLPGWVKDSGWMLVGAAALAGGVTFALTAQRGRFLQLVESLIRRVPRLLPEKWQSYVVSRLHNGLDSLDVLQQRWDLVKIALWSTLIWLTAVLTNSFTLMALGIHLDFSASLLVLVGLMIGISVAVVPGRIGVFEWICVLALAIYGVGQAQALSYGLLLHAIVYVPTTLLGVVSFFILSRRQTPPQPSPSENNRWSGGVSLSGRSQRKPNDGEGADEIGVMDGND